MFLDKNNSQDQFTPVNRSAADIFWTTKRLKLVGWLALAVAVVIIAAVVWFVYSRQQTPATISRPGDNSSTLPESNNNLSTDTDGNGNNNQTKAEELYFGSLYQPIVDPVTVKAEALTLPINVKRDAANYYPFTRYINLDKVIDNLNNRGFAVIDNPFGKDSKDFLSAYAKLNEHNLPFLVTSDFLIYYYQNRVKSIFKNAEADEFYKAFWDLNKAMYDQADQRYRDRYAKVGLLNDPILEALRLEAVYFAVNLELLEPESNQVLPATKGSVDSEEALAEKFSAVEAAKYNFTAPSYLDPSIKKELELIAKAGRGEKTTKSAALLYKRDYSEFSIPKEYGRNARLINFYLASRWTTSLFPLFFINDECPSCLLDKDDWSINITAAAMIARDLSADQSWKNQWAKIYKAMSYFSSMRGELTYLNYDQAFHDLFGQRPIEEVFDLSNNDRDSEMLKFRDRLAGIDFDPAQGGLNRQLEEGKRLSGMRILQDEFNPEMYVFDKLTFDKVGNFVDYNPKTSYQNFNTRCDAAGQTVFRCRAIGLDIMNLLYDEPVTSAYFKLNTNYQNYANQVPTLRKHFADFDNIDWHQNLYWNSLDISRKYMNSRKQDSFSHTLGAAWSDQVLATGLGAAMNARMPLDAWRYSFKKEGSLSSADTVVKYHYIEPNLSLANEMLANARMMFKSFVALGLAQDNDADFTELVDDMTKVRALVVKQYQNEELSYNDWAFINELVGRYYVEDLGEKERSIDFKDPNGNKSYRLGQSISGFKLLIEAHRQQGRMILVAGPIFNFSEVKK